jgi:hypothetical protein
MNMKMEIEISSEQEMRLANMAKILGIKNLGALIKALAFDRFDRPIELGILYPEELKKWLECEFERFGILGQAFNRELLGRGGRWVLPFEHDFAQTHNISLPHNLPEDISRMISETELTKRAEREVERMEIENHQERQKRALRNMQASATGGKRP